MVPWRPMEIFRECWPGETSLMVRNQIMNGCVTGNCRAWMFEKMPRMVCLPEPGSMWTPSQVSQARSCGLDCTGGEQGGRGGAGQIILLGDGGGTGLPRGVLLALLTKPPTPPMLDSLADYPQWLVVACGTIVVAAAIWVLMKLLKWTLWVLLFAVLAIGLGTAAWLMFR